MKINVKAKPGAREERIDPVGENNFVVAVKEPPVQGRVNIAIMDLLADYFGVPKTSVRLVSGFSSRQKVFEILK